MNDSKLRVPRTLALFAAIVLLWPAAIAQAQTQIKPGFNLFSPQDDVQIGQQSAAQAEQQLPMLNDSVINEYVNAIGQRLAPNAGGPKFQYRFRVVNSSDINAFALPGGFVYINRGVIENTKNEGELAGVMAHEISHVALRHGTHQASKAYLAQAGIGILGGLLGSKVGQGTANIINQVGGLGLNVLFLKYGRDIETQADVRGAQILAASGYTPLDLISFFTTLESIDPAKKTNFLSDHPAPPDRIARIKKEAAMLHASSTPTENVAQLHQIQARLRETPAAPSPQVARGGPPTPQRPAGSAPQAPAPVQSPSSSMRTFVSPSALYQISYPANWQVYAQGSTGVTFAPQGGVGEINGQSDVVYGAIINRYEPFDNAGPVSLQSATNDLIKQLRQASPYLQLASKSAQRFRWSGSNALVATLRGTDPNTGLPERLTVVTRLLSLGVGERGPTAIDDDDLIYLLFITPERDAAAYQRVLQSMVSSIRINDRQQR